MNKKIYLATTLLGASLALVACNSQDKENEVIKEEKNKKEDVIKVSELVSTTPNNISEQELEFRKNITLEFLENFLTSSGNRFALSEISSKDKVKVTKVTNLDSKEGNLSFGSITSEEEKGEVRTTQETLEQFLGDSYIKLNLLSESESDKILEEGSSSEFSGEMSKMNEFSERVTTVIKQQLAASVSEGAYGVDIDDNKTGSLNFFLEGDKDSFISAFIFLEEGEIKNIGLFFYEENNIETLKEIYSISK